MKSKSLSQRLMLEDIARSGLTAKDAKDLKLTPLTAENILETTEFVSDGGYSIPYYTIAGKPTGFFRIRILDGTSTGFKKRVMKYYQPAKTLPELYIPRLPVVSWSATARDTTTRVYITEGEKKAACAVKHGLPTLGLGGVWSWKSKKKNVPLLDGFRDFEWKEREVVIVFDNDIHTNENIALALNALAKELYGLGARVMSTKLPYNHKEKVGLDDYLMKYGLEEFLELPVEKVGNDDELWKLNTELVYVEELAGVLQLSTGRVLNKSALVDLAYANRFVLAPDGRGNIVKVNAAERWLRWDNRRTCRRLSYSPGQAQVLPDGGYNLWKGWGVEPKAGDVAPFIKLINHIFKEDKEAKTWFLQWLAYPLQNPGVKMFTGTLLFSLAHGTGKSLIGYTMGKIYGDNFSVVSGEELRSSFNEWAKNKQFVLGEEITGSDKRTDGDRLKHMVSREQVSINTKYQPVYSLSDCANYLLTTNHPDALFLENSDRRMFVYEIEGAPLPTEFYTKVYNTWKETTGPAALFYYLLHSVDCSTFDPRAPALMTNAKADMHELSRSDVDAWAVQLANDPMSLLQIDGKPLQRDLYSVSELLGLYDPTGAKRTTLIALSKALRRAGLRRVGVVRTKRGLALLWAVRNVQYWTQAQHKDKAVHYEGATTKKAPNF